jgi:hypothetical protein
MDDLTHNRISLSAAIGAGKRALLSRLYFAVAKRKMTGMTAGAM